jgi:hypothetical protein
MVGAVKNPYLARNIERTKQLLPRDERAGDLRGNHSGAPDKSISGIS